MAAFKSISGETKIQFKARLSAEGRWSEFVAAREGLVRGGVSRPDAWKRLMVAPEWNPCGAVPAGGSPAEGSAAAGFGEVLPAVEAETADLLPDSKSESSELVEIVNSAPGGGGVLQDAPFSDVSSGGLATGRRARRREGVMRQSMPAGGGAEIGGPTAFEVGEEEISREAAVKWVVAHLDCDPAGLGRVPNQLALNLWRWAMSSKESRNELFKMWFKATEEQAGGKRLFEDDGRDLVALIDRVSAAATASSREAESEEPW